MFIKGKAGDTGATGEFRLVSLWRLLGAVRVRQHWWNCMFCSSVRCCLRGLLLVFGDVPSFGAPNDNEALCFVFQGIILAPVSLSYFLWMGGLCILYTNEVGLCVFTGSR